MARRKRMARRRSRRVFTKTASKTHRKNLRDRIMRGGWRL